MKKKLMILGASILQLPAIIEAKKLDLDVIVCDMDPNAIGFKESGIVREYVSTIDTKRILEVAKSYKINGIMTLATDLPMRSVAAVCKYMNLVGIGEDTAFKATNKYAMREALKEHNVPIPDFYKASNYKEFLETVDKFKLSFIVKPADNSGSKGVCLVEKKTSEEQLLKIYEYSHSYSRNGDVVIEEYMNGPEVSVETISFNGKCNIIQITDKLTTGAPYFVEMGHSQPSNLDKGILKEIEKVTVDANKAIGIEIGPSHTEIIVTKEGPKIVELGARLGGDNITTHLVPLSTGVNLVNACIKIALNQEPDIIFKFKKGSAIRYFKQKQGIIKRIEGLDKANKIQGIKQISVVHGEGDKLTEINCSGARMGFVIAQAETANKAIDICESAINKISVVME